MIRIDTLADALGITKRKAAEILEAFPTLQNAADAPEKQLEELVGKSRTDRLRALARLLGEQQEARCSEVVQLTAARSSLDICERLAWMRGKQEEHLVVLHLNARHRIIGEHRAHVGTPTGVSCDAPSILRQALAAGARAIVIAHNHPSGDPTPSPTDINCASKMRRACDAVGITLCDFVILGAVEHWSAAEKGVL